MVSPLENSRCVLIIPGNGMFTTVKTAVPMYFICDELYRFSEKVNKMNETGKVLCGFFAVVAGFIAAAAWSLDPVGNVWTVRILFTAVSAALFLLLLRALFKKDLAPDYIRMVSGSVFERSGFQFATEPIHLEDHCCFRIWYQNRHAKPCTARILLTPQKTFLMKVPR